MGNIKEIIYKAVEKRGDFIPLRDVSIDYSRDCPYFFLYATNQEMMIRKTNDSDVLVGIPHNSVQDKVILFDITMCDTVDDLFDYDIIDDSFTVEIGC